MLKLYAYSSTTKGKNPFGLFLLLGQQENRPEGQSSFQKNQAIRKKECVDNITNTLKRLLKEFSEDNSISQKEIIEIAVVEFLKKYGYEKQVKAVLYI